MKVSLPSSVLCCSIAVLGGLRAIEREVHSTVLEKLKGIAAAAAKGD